MKKVKFKLNPNGVRQMLRSKGAMDACRPYAERILSAANSSAPGYEMEERRYPDRNGYSVFPADDDAYYDNLSNDTLQRVRGW